MSNRKKLLGSQRKIRAFSLSELLVVLTILGILCGMLFLVPSSSWLFNSAEGSVREAEAVRRWLEQKMMTATMERVNFSLQAPATTPLSSLIVSWSGGNRANERKDAARGYSFRLRSLVAGKSVFSWLHHTVTPAMTIEVRHSEKASDPPDVYVVVSGRGSVSVRKTPP